MSRKTKLLISSALFISVLVIDQIIKIVVKTGMQLGEHIEVTSWFHIAFVENNGMAFGWELFGGKLILTLFRLVAVSVIGWFIWREIMRRRPTGYIICLTLIMAGAAGNIIDCLFYGLIFSESTYDAVATLGSYAPFMQGKVVDMFYFPLWTWPDWVPGLGGRIFFEPVFNFADSCVTCGAIYLILFHWKFFAKE